MLNTLARSNRSLLLGSVLTLAAAAGWGSFAYSAYTSGQREAALMAERDIALNKHQRLQEAAGELADVQAKLGSARFEYSRVMQNWAETRGKMGSAQQELAALTKRVEQARDRVSQTGSIKPAQPAKAPAARKP